ncbi:MAG: hypothetical protein MUF64_20345 [Polyangiaceae bacterium]|nr:hypothetical protein [Polyangiaceae bacterium]
MFVPGLLAHACAPTPSSAPLPRPAPSASAVPSASAAPSASASSSPDALASSSPPDAAASPPGSAAPAASGQPLASGERWGPGLVDSGPCAPHGETRAEELASEPGGPRAKFSYHGYRVWKFRVQRAIEEKTRTHCVEVLFPGGKKNSDDRPVRVAEKIDDGWLRAMENTLQRLPWRQLQVVRRVVIDDRPKEHGIGPFDRRSADDARDGRTLWLHERLFTEPNHWATGNHGRYWSYHTDIDGQTLDNLPAGHDRFSPILLHEIGHLVAYSVVNRNPANEAVPACAKVCGDRGGCKGMLARVREEGCISAYCMPFQFETGTENWAEMFRFYYQSKATRALLAEAGGACVPTLDGINEGLAPPWERGLPDIPSFHRTLWKSCDERPCKGW